MVVYYLYNSINSLSKIVGRDVCRHSDSDSGSAVYKEIRESRGKDHRLFFSAVEIRHEVHGVLVQVLEHCH